MKRILRATLLLLALAFAFVTGWILGSAHQIANSCSAEIELQLFQARQLEAKGESVPDEVLMRLDGAVETAHTTYPLVVSPKMRSQVRRAILKVADFRDTHPKWVEYYHLQTLAPDGRLVSRLDAILARARRDWR